MEGERSMWENLVSRGQEKQKREAFERERRMYIRSFFNTGTALGGSSLPPPSLMQVVRSTVHGQFVVSTFRSVWLAVSMGEG